MSESEFFGPQTTRVMHKAAQSIDLNPYNAPATNFMWGRLNEGMDYSNELRHEIANKAKQLEQLKEKLAYYERIAENSKMEGDIVRLKGEIEKVNKKIELEEFNQERLDHMILVKHKDTMIGWHNFKNVYLSLQTQGRKLEKNIDDIMTLNKMLQGQMEDFKHIQQKSNQQHKEIEQINFRKAEQMVKLESLERNVELEDNYNQRKVQLLSKAKKDKEAAKEARIETQKKLNKRKQAALQELITSFDRDFDRIALVSKHLPNKADYIQYYGDLEENNKDLEERIKQAEVEINLLEKIELPTVKEELGNLKAAKTEEKVLFETRDLAISIHDKKRRNELSEKRIENQQRLITDATRGVMTIFHQLLENKKELGLEKLDGITINMKSLGDVLLLSGEIVETIKNIHVEPSEIKSQTYSAGLNSSNDII